MGDLNWLAIIVAALAGFLVGGLWYGPLFGKAWMREVGKTEADLKRVNPVKVYGLTFLLALLSALMMGHMFAIFTVTSLRSFLMISGGIAIAFVIPGLWTNYLFQGARARLAFIDAGYWLCFYLAMGLVFALFAMA